ncbi:MAG: hypothetical protein CMI02_07280 [Oceanospirillaceae bacterium]|nr:hypothetical protein [Oceanospirillaceae bacterium]MBT11819.1 hypothetical protein [Oceanospirillaceae bacterium]|tara:strand:+ start:73640 stop:73999 length:360 start_codon:yes stop_codon:yes gene_type:complete
MYQKSYELLGLPEGAGRDDVKKAFKRLAMTFHPDRNPDGQAHFAALCRAYQTLMDALDNDRRQNAARRYDAARATAQTDNNQTLSISRERRTSRRLPQHRRFELVQESHYKGISVSEEV